MRKYYPQIVYAIILIASLNTNLFAQPQYYNYTGTVGANSYPFNVAAGKEAAVLVNEYKTTGEYTIEFNATGFSSGVYFYTLKINEFSDTKKLLLIK